MGLSVKDITDKVLESVKKLLKTMMDGLLKGLMAVFIGLFTIFGFVLKPVGKLGFTVVGKLWSLVIKIAPFVQFLPYLFASSLMMPFIIPIIIISMAFSFLFGKYVLLLPFIFMFVFPLGLYWYVGTQVEKLKKLDLEKEIGKILKKFPGIIEDIFKTITKEIVNLFKKIKI